MKVAFLAPSISRKAGGIFEISRRLAQTLHANNYLDVAVLGLKDEFSDADLPIWQPVHAAPLSVVGPRSFGYSPAMRRTLKRESPDLTHVHGLWMYPTLAAARWSRVTGRPYMVTIHGMLDPWALRHSRWKKSVAAWLYENACLRGATCIHVNTKAEMNVVRQYGLRNPIAIIPNGMDIPDSRSDSPSPWIHLIKSGTKVILYLGRLHPKKGLQVLLRGWKEVLRKDSPSDHWDLVIAGWDQEDHRAELITTADKLGIRGRVHFVGPLFGEAKSSALCSADAVVLPSFSEGLPMAVLEAWANCLPVLMTSSCNLSEGFAAGAAIPIQPEPESIDCGLRQLTSMSDSCRRKMGMNGRELVRQRFTWDAVGNQMNSLYYWMLNGGSTPDTLVFS